MKRVVIAACLIVTLASLSLVGLVAYQSNQAVIAAAQAQAANQAKTIELLTRSQATSAEILQQLQNLTKAAQSPRSPDWIPVAFKLTLESPDGPPAVGWHVVLQQGSSGLVGYTQIITRESDAGGLVDFGVVRPGDWEFVISRSLEDQHSWTCTGNINVLPGTKIARTIVCPGPPPARAPVKLRVDWPADLAGKGLCLAVTYTQAPSIRQPPLKWKVIDSLGFDRCRTVLYGPGTKQNEIVGTSKLDLWYVLDSKGVMTPYGSSEIRRAYADFYSENVRSESDSIAMEVGSLIPQRLVVLRPYVPRNAAIKGERFEVLANAETPDVRFWNMPGYYGNADDRGSTAGNERTPHRLQWQCDR